MNTKTLLILSALTLGLTPMTGPSKADSAMNGMDMSGTKTAQKPSTTALSVTATINPAIPKSGDNTLNLMISDSAGKPVTGLKLTGSVAMTSMDMGTTQPAFAEIGGGHYKATVTFSMDGPWRVVIRRQGAKVAVLDFEPGSKTPWKSPQTKYTLPLKAVGTLRTSPAIGAKAPDADGMAGMDMSGGKAAAQPANMPEANKPEANKPEANKPDTMAGMKMDATARPDMAGKGNNTSGTSAMPGMDMSGAGTGGMNTGIADMKTATIPELQETGTYTATGDEDWKKQTGFGHNAPMVGMMNQMMVGGSGMEGMKMAPMDMKFDAKNYAKPEGDDTAGTDSMAGMDMSSGKTAAKLGDKPAPMAGMDMSGKDGGMKKDASAQASPATATPATAAMSDAPVSSSASIAPKITATINVPKAGDNTLQITLTDAEGKPVTGSKITTSVAMTSMDMGTTHPTVKDLGSGKYATTVNFGMAGPWRVQVKVVSPGQKPVLKAFDFMAK
jgi:nitrogen fixation protein FixH